MTVTSAVAQLPLPDPLLTPKEVAAFLRVSESWVREHTTRCEPKLPGIKLGHHWRYRASELELFLQQLGVRGVKQSHAA